MDRKTYIIITGGILFIILILIIFNISNLSNFSIIQKKLHRFHYLKALVYGANHPVELKLQFCTVSPFR